MLQTEFKSQVDNLMNILFGAGVASHATIIEQINYLVFLRSLSKKDDSAIVLDPAAERIFNGQLSKFHWDNLLLLNADALFTTLEEIFRQLPELATDKTIKLLYRDAHVKVFDKPTLRRLLHEIEKMMAGLEKEAVSGQTDIFGDMYEYLLGKMSQAGTLGSFRTPRHIIKFMVDIIDPVKGETVLDPACGTAGFLVAALEHIKEKYTSEEYKKEGRYPMDLLKPGERDFVYKNTFTGFDSDFDMFKFGLMNLYLHKLEHPNIKRQNTLVDTAGDRTKWDVILANPPFAGALDVDSISEDIRMGTRATEILFLRYMIDHLSPNGRAGVIVPDGVVFANNIANKKIRKILVEDAGLWCVVSLPGGIFNPYAGVKTSILFFDKSLKGKSKEVLFVKIENDGFDLGATKRKIDKNDLPESDELIQLYRNYLKQNLATFLPKKKPKLQYAVIPASTISKDENYYLNGERYFNNRVQPKGVYKNSTIGELLNLDFGTRITKSKNTGTKYPVYGGGGESFRTDSFNRSDDYVISRFAMSANCVHYVPEKFFLLDSGLTLSVKDEYKKLISKEFLGKILLAIQPVIYSCGRGNAQKNLEVDQFKKINIPLPPIEIQEKIVKEVKKIEDDNTRLINTVKENAEKIRQKITTIWGGEVK